LWTQASVYGNHGNEEATFVLQTFHRPRKPSDRPRHENRSASGSMRPDAPRFVFLIVVCEVRK